MPFEQMDDGARIFFTDHGSGDVLVFVHGWACDSNDWIWQLAHFGEDHRVIALDLRGHGRSTASSESAYTPVRFAKDLALLLDRLEARPAVVIGHSLGGTVASQLAVAEPAPVKAIVAVDPAYGPAHTEAELAPFFAALRSEACHDAVAAMFAELSAPSTPRALVTWHQRRAMGTPAEVIAATSEGLLDGSGRVGPSADLLAQRRCPVLTIFRSAESADWERSIPRPNQSSVVVWPDVGHWLHQERSDEFNTLVRSWISELPGGI